MFKSKPTFNWEEKLIYYILARASESYNAGLITIIIIKIKM